MKRDLAGTAGRFQLEGEFLDAAPYGNGHINETYVVRCRAAAGVGRYIFQRINDTIFKDVPALMENITRVTEHVQSKVTAAGGRPRRESLILVPTVDGRRFLRDDEGGWWRAYIFIEGARTYETVEDLKHVYGASRAFGIFQKQLADLPAPRLHETIPNFHHTPTRLAAFREAVEKDVKNRAASVRPEIEFVEQRAGEVARLTEALASGELPERVTHNDTKFNNVMIDDHTGEGVCVIDLDTVMPGTAAYDFGDSVRIGASTAAEDERDLSKVGFDLRMFERLAAGYLDAARDFLTPPEVGVLAFAAKLMTFECGMRFLADHLAGDVYFRIHREGHNLDRCRTQFKMVAEMEKAAEQTAQLVEKYFRGK